MKKSDKFWACWVDGKTGGTYHKHFFSKEARAEAERLARQPQNKGSKVFIMEMKAYCEVPETPLLDWHYVDCERIL